MADRERWSAGAISAREEAFEHFVQRESHFTGDVSHELRTPLTVMQGGLEVLEARLQNLVRATPQAGELVPVEGRLLRTTSDMTRTVRTLLLLARKPGEIQAAALDCSLILRDIINEMEREGVVCPVEFPQTPSHAQADSLAAMLALLEGGDRLPELTPVAASSLAGSSHKKLPWLNRVISSLPP